MRRSFIGLVAVALLLAGGAGTSRAAPGAVQHFRFHGAVAEAAWARTVGTDFVGAYVQVAEAKDASELVAEQFHERYDEHGPRARWPVRSIRLLTGHRHSCGGVATSRRARRVTPSPGRVREPCEEDDGRSAKIPRHEP